MAVVCVIDVAATALLAYEVPSYGIAASGLLFAWGGASEVVLESVDCAVSPSDSVGLGAAGVGLESSSHCLYGAAVPGAVAASSVPSSDVVAVVGAEVVAEAAAPEV